MSNTTKVNDLEYAVGVHYAGLMIKRAEPFEIYNLFSEKAKMPKNSGDQFKVGGFLPLDPALAALTEGTKPAGKKLTIIRKTIRVKQYGDYVEITDKCAYTMEDPVMNKSTVVLGEQMGRGIAHLKSSLIDLEAYGENYGDRGQAFLKAA